MSKHLVLSVKTYDFKNNDNERIQGAKLTYLNKKPSNRDTETGNPPFIVSIQNKDLVSKFKEVPGLYELEFEQVVGKNNKPEIVLVDSEPIAPIDMDELFSVEK